MDYNNERNLTTSQFLGIRILTKTTVPEPRILDRNSPELIFNWLKQLSLDEIEAIVTGWEVARVIMLERWQELGLDLKDFKWRFTNG